MAGTLYRVDDARKTAQTAKRQGGLNAESEEHHMPRVRLRTLRQVTQGEKEARFARDFLSDLEGPTP